jgi:hypothetical protein
VNATDYQAAPIVWLAKHFIIFRVVRRMKYEYGKTIYVGNNTQFDLLSTLELYEHEYGEEDGKRVHFHLCRRCALTAHLLDLKKQASHLLREIERAIGELKDT